MQQQQQAMDIDPVDDGPRPLASPVVAVPTRPNTSAATSLSVPANITQEEQARQAIEMLRSEDLSARVSAASRLADVAQVLGPERTRDELLPYITDGVDDEDEVLLALATSLGTMVDHVGGPLHAHTLFRPLELLLTVEETLVRETAAASCQTIASTLDEDSFQHNYAPLLQRLAATEWFTARISAAALLPHAHTRIGQAEQRNQHVQLFAQLCADDTPMVRRVAAQHLGTMVQNVVQMEGRDVLTPDQVVVQTLLPLYETLAQPGQPDSVRLQTAANCVAFGNVLAQFADDNNMDDNHSALQEHEEALLQRVLPLIVAAIDDRSWRVRWTAASKFAAVVQAFAALPSAVDALIPAYEKLLQDPEAEVRTAATLNLAQVAACPTPVIQTSANPSSPQANDVPVDTAGQPRVAVAVRLVQKITSLTEDDSEHVRAALANVATALAPILGRDATIMYLVPPVLLLLRDAASEVRLNLISSLSALNEVIGVDLLSQSLLPAILDLAQDGKWRIRLAIIEHIPLLARQLGRDFFTEKLSALCVDWLGDDIAVIRQAAAKNLKELTSLFGTEWAIENLGESIDEFVKNESYLRRLTALQAFALMALEMDSDTARIEVLPKILEMSTDSVANVRFNVARELQIVTPHCGAPIYEAQVLPVLNVLMEDDDRDVRYYAEKTVTALDNTFAEGGESS